MRNRIRITAAFIAGMCVVAVPAVVAHNSGYLTSLKKPKRTDVSGPDSKYSGRVISAKPGCRAGRIVIVRLLAQADSAGDRARDKTDRLGRYSVRLTPPSELHQISVTVLTKDLRRNRNHYHRCRAHSWTYNYPRGG